MPCHSYGPRTQDLLETTSNEVKRLKTELDKVTTFLCETGQILKNVGGYKLLSTECLNYLTEHYNFDRIRIQKEIEQKKQELNKLEIELKNLP